MLYGSAINIVKIVEVAEESRLGFVLGILYGFGIDKP